MKTSAAMMIFVLPFALIACRGMAPSAGSEKETPPDREVSVTTGAVEYDHNDQTLEGYLARPEEVEEPLPGVLICHEWTGLGEYEKMRARQLAKEGYVVLSADIYGKNMRPSSHEEAAEISGRFRENRDLFRARVREGLNHLRENPHSDADRLAAIGYCFGGTAALELARSGAEISAVVSIHGGLSTERREDAGNIRASVLVLHGGDDPHVPMEQVNNFTERMKEFDVEDWQVVVYGNTYHSFTNPDSGSDPSGGSAYNETSAARAWEDMLQLFDERF